MITLLKMNKSRAFYTLFMVLVMVPGFFSYTFAQRKKTKKEKNESTVSMEVHYDAERIRFTNMLGDALTLKTIDDIDNALKKLNECYKIWPDNQVVNYELASIYIYKKKYNIALPYIEKAVKGDPKNKWYLIDYIEVLIRLDKFKETEKVFKDLISLEPDNIDYISEFAELYMSEKKYKEAIALFEDIETKTGVHPEISLQKQKLYKAMGKTQASLDEIQKLIKAFPLEAQYYGILAETYLEMKKKDEALNAYLKVLELEPDNSIIHLALANFYQEKGDHEKAFEHIKLAFQNPDVDIDDKIKVLLSYYQISENNQIRKEQAYTLIQLLIDTHPNDPKSWAIKGDFLIRDNRYDQAIDVFEKVNQLDKGRYPVWEQLLSLYYNKKDWPMLSERSREATELFPLQPMPYLYWGTSFLYQQKYQEAVDVLNTGKDLVLDNPTLKSEFFSTMGECYFSLRQYEKMESMYENAININPLNTNAKNDFAYYLALSGRKLDKAHTLILDILKSYPKNIYYLDTYAVVLFESGDYQKSLEIIKEVMNNGGDTHGIMLEHYGDILFKNGQTEAAKEMWIKAKNTGGKLSEVIDQKINSGQWIK